MSVESVKGGMDLPSQAARVKVTRQTEGDPWEMWGGVPTSEPHRHRDLPTLSETEPEDEAETQVSSHCRGLCSSQGFTVFVKKILLR